MSASGSSHASFSTTSDVSDGASAPSTSSASERNNLVSVERQVRVTESQVLMVNGTPITLEGEEGKLIESCLLAGKMPDQDLINHLLIKAGLLLKPAKNVQAEMSVRQTNVNRQDTRVIKGGKVVDHSSNTTKEVKTLHCASTIDIWGSANAKHPPPVDSDIPAKLLARVAMSEEAKDMRVYSVLLWSRLYVTPTQLLTEIAAIMAMRKSSERFLESTVSVMSRWMTWFPEDFMEEAMIQKTKKLFQTIINLQQDLFSSKLNQLLSTLTSHLAAVRKHESWLESLDDRAKCSLVVEDLKPADEALPTAKELTRIELEHLAFLGPAEFVSMFAKDCISKNLNASPTKVKVMSCIDDARIRSAGKTKKFERYVSWFNRLSYLVATSICRHKKKKHRVETIEFWIEVARECVNIGNFNSMMGIITGLNMFPVERLKKTWHKIQSGKFAVLEHQMDPTSNFLSYRSTFKAAIARSEAATEDRQRVTIPFLSLFVKDLYFAKENSGLDLRGHQLDLDKAEVIAGKVREFCSWKDVNCPYERNGRIEKFLRESPLYTEEELDFESFLCEPPNIPTEKDRHRKLKEKYKRASTASSDS